MKQAPIQLTFSCQEDLETMSCTSKGKFCNACQKEVIDFTKMSRTQLDEIRKGQPELCGIFLPEQLDPSLHPIEFPNVKSWAFFSSILVSLNVSNLSAQVPVEENHVTISLIDNLLAGNQIQTPQNAEEFIDNTESQTIGTTEFPGIRKFRKNSRYHRRYIRRTSRTWYWSWRFPFVHQKPRRSFGVPRWL